MSKLKTCAACRFYASGGKSRIAMNHTCGEFGRLHTMKIPKVNPTYLIDVIVQRTGMVETKNALLVKCQKQVIEGVTIPQGYEIWIPNYSSECVNNSFSSQPVAHIPGWKVNEILRTLYIDKLRNG